MTKKNMTGKLINEYKEKIPLYQDFCSTLNNLLISLLESSGYKYQISYRVKSIESLLKKIQRKTAEGKRYKRLEDVKDLAGIRIIFYLESDKKNFLSDLYREFTPQKLKLKERHKEKGYRATHIILQFGRKRLALGEYKKFSNLNIEIQLTSALFHAWSEIEHDIFYKLDEQTKLGGKDIIKKLKKDLEDTMVNYIHKASDKFESVAFDLRNMRIQQNKKM